MTVVTTTSAANTDVAIKVNQELTREQALSLPGRERVRLVNALQVMYPRAQRILAQMEYCYERALAGVAEPPSLLVTGRLGAGKTTLSECFLSRHPAVRVAPSPRNPVATWSRPVLRMATPVNPRETDFAICLLKAVGDVCFNKGRKTDMTNRLLDYLYDCGTKAIVLDELQHMVEKRTWTVLLDVSDWLKNLAKQANVSLILIGLQGVSDMILEANEQLSSLFTDPCTLEPFSWAQLSPEEEAKPLLERNVSGTRDEFRMVLAQIESLLPLREASNLTDLDMAQRIFVASGGLMRYLMRLVREAAVLALQRGEERLTQRLLWEAFEEKVGGHFRGLANPFVPGSRVPTPTPLPSVQRYELRSAYRGGALRLLPVGKIPTLQEATIGDFVGKLR